MAFQLNPYDLNDGRTAAMNAKAAQIIQDAAGYVWGHASNQPDDCLDRKRRAVLHAVGFPGHGKSSWIKSNLWLANPNGPFPTRPEAGDPEVAQGHCTTKVQTYRLHKTSHADLVDVQGIESAGDVLCNRVIEEVTRLLLGRIGDGESLKLKADNERNWLSKSWKWMFPRGTRCTCAVVIHSAKFCFTGAVGERIGAWKPLLDHLRNNHGIPVIVVITMLDKLMDNEDNCKTDQWREIKRENDPHEVPDDFGSYMKIFLSKIRGKLRLGMDSVFPVRNMLTDEDTFETQPRGAYSIATALWAALTASESP